MDYIETSGLISLTDIHVSLDIRVPQTFVADCTLLRFAFQRVKLTLTDQKQTTMNVISGVVLHPTNIEPQIIRKYEYYRFIHFFWGGERIRVYCPTQLMYAVSHCACAHIICAHERKAQTT